MGGVSARPWEMVGACCGVAGVWAKSDDEIRIRAMRNGFFMSGNLYTVRRRGVTKRE
jgi:hypothetical protein